MQLNKIDKSKISFSDLKDYNDEVQFWKSKSPQERFLAIELMREILYGKDATSARLQRILGIVDL